MIKESKVFSGKRHILTMNGGGAHSDACACWGFRKASETEKLGSLRYLVKYLLDSLNPLVHAYPENGDDKYGNKRVARDKVVQDPNS